MGTSIQGLARFQYCNMGIYIVLDYGYHYMEGGLRVVLVHYTKMLSFSEFTSGQCKSNIKTVHTHTHTQPCLCFCSQPAEYTHLFVAGRSEISVMYLKMCVCLQVFQVSHTSGGAADRERQTVRGGEGV